MDPSQRYEIVDTIASGDFAVVYRARDLELGRAVAVKQIHAQYLSDPQQLARYWQEAQLLASLQHPNILTVYDVVRPRGWLILELMQRSLKPESEGDGIDLVSLRRVLIDCAEALRFLHANGIIHGDIKPSNLLLSFQGRIALGDFGLARRASSEQGSLLKGTTKYMAPELVSNQFGPVGPASDLYSLGFTAYELMCGKQFDTLFPGLSSFGRDLQIAWMMWHAAADRRLPAIGKVLEGVPDDLAQVIQRLTIKDQSRRYQSAEDVLRDLRSGGYGVAPPPVQDDAEARAAREAAAKKRKLTRIGAFVALAFSLVLSVAMLLPTREAPPPPAPPEPVRGVVRNVLVGERRLVVESSGNGGVEEVDFRPGDRFFVNDLERTLRDLIPGDEVEVSEFREASGRRVKEVKATRPVGHVGLVAEVKSEEAALTLAVTEGEEKGKSLTIYVPPELPIMFNGKPDRDGRPVVLADLQVDDRTMVRHKGAPTGRVATELSVTRVVEAEGILREINVERGELVLAVGPADTPTLVRLPLADKVDVTVNGRRDMDQKLLRPADLKPGDKATVAHDVRVVRVDAYRILGTGGIVEQVHVDAGTLDVAIEGAGRATSFRIGPQCRITLTGQPAELADLRRGDEVDITHDDPGAASPEPIAIVARRPPDENRWALLVANQEFDDQRLSALEHPVPDARLLRDTLTSRYKVPATQVLLLSDESLVRLEQGIPDFLRRLGPADRLLVYVAGNAYQDRQGAVYFAPKNFDFARMDVTGLPLQWLVDELERCAAGEKLLLLDTSQAGEGTDLKQQPSAIEMIGALDAPPGRAPLRTITAIAGTGKGERGLTLAGGHRGLFAAVLAAAYAGAADKNRDTRIEPTELFTYLNEAMPREAAKLSAAQTPHLVLPDDRPPRLTEEAKKAIRRLAVHLRAARPDRETIDPDFAAARELAGAELEPRLLFGLLLLKSRDRDEVTRHFEELRVENPDLLLPLQATAWGQFDARRYPAAVGQLTELASRIPVPTKDADGYDLHTLGIFTWAGQLREYAASAVPDAWQAPAEALVQLDAAVARHGLDARQAFEQGRTATRNVVLDFDRRITAAESDAENARLRVERRQLGHYASFPFDEEAARILAGLDKE